MQSNGASMQQLNQLATSSIYNRLVLDNALYATITGGFQVSAWTCATVVVGEIHQPHSSVMQWHLGIYLPQAEHSVTIDMMSDIWSLHWEERISMVVYRTGHFEEGSIRHCILLHNRLHFLQLVSLCANARVYQYMQLETSLSVDL